MTFFGILHKIMSNHKDYPYIRKKKSHSALGSFQCLFDIRNDIIHTFYPD